MGWELEVMSGMQFDGPLAWKEFVGNAAAGDLDGMISAAATGLGLQRVGPELPVREGS